VAHAAADTPGRILAIDYGTVRLGLAISDPSQKLASPLANYQRVNAQHDLQYLQRMIDAERVVQIVVGLPVHLDGRESQKSIEARGFAALLQQQTGIPVVLHDERFTSVEAEAHLLAAHLSRKKRKARRDMLAAQLLLTSFMDSDRTAGSSAPGGLDDS
jgi:putative Holliday junction resolvase